MDVIFCGTLIYHPKADRVAVRDEVLREAGRYLHVDRGPSKVVRVRCSADPLVVDRIAVPGSQHRLWPHLEHRVASIDERFDSRRKRWSVEAHGRTELVAGTRNPT